MTEDERDDLHPPAGPKPEPNDAADGPEAEIEPRPADLTPGARPTPGIRPAAVSTKSAAAAPSPSEIAVHIDDRISAIYVLVVVAVFVGILLYGILGGVGGALAPSATPTPSPAPSVSASP
jgi:hypothetical protein